MPHVAQHDVERPCVAALEIGEAAFQRARERRCWPASAACRNWPASIGVSVSDMHDARPRTAALSVSANSRISRPTTPPMNTSGVNTAISEIEMVRMVKAISPEPGERGLERPLAVLDPFPDHLFHDDGVVDHEADGDGHRHQRQVVETEVQRQHHRAGGQQRQTGMIALGISVARTSRRNRKITITTRTMVISRVISTSRTEARMVWVRSARMLTLIAGGMSASQAGQRLVDAVDGLDDVGAGLP